MEDNGPRSEGQVENCAVRFCIWWSMMLSKSPAHGNALGWPAGWWSCSRWWRPSGGRSGHSALRWYRQWSLCCACHPPTVWTSWAAEARSPPLSSRPAAAPSGRSPAWLHTATAPTMHRSCYASFLQCNMVCYSLQRTYLELLKTFSLIYMHCKSTARA